MKYDTQLIKKVALFEEQTGAKVKDAFYYRDKLTFVVQAGEMGKALGRNKSNVKKLQNMMNEKIKIVEYDDDLLDFIVNFLNPLDIQDISEEEDIVTIRGGDTKTNGLIIGRGGKNLRELEDVVNNYFDVEEIKVE